MLRKIGIVIIAIVLFQSFMIKDDSFTKYYQSLKIIDMPLIIDCEKSIQYPDYSNISEKLDSKFRPEGFKTLGRIELNKNIISIIQVAQAEDEFPVIFNYKRDGTPIDSLCLLSGSCSSSPQFHAHSIGKIESDRNITMLDSSFYYKLDKDGDRLEKCDSIVICNWQCKMDTDGHFVKRLIKKENK